MREIVRSQLHQALIKSITLVILSAMKTAISIPDPIFHEAEAFARKLKLSRSQLYATALAAFLEQQQKLDVTAKLNEVYERVASEIDPEWKRAQAAVLEAEPW
jgi:antitoxin MazE6